MVSKNDNAAGGFLLGIDTGEHDTIVKRAELHGTFSRRVDTSEIRGGDRASGASLNRTLYADCSDATAFSTLIDRVPALTCAGPSGAASRAHPKRAGEEAKYVEGK